MTAADPRAAAANASLADRIRSTQTGHLAAQKALWQGGQELVDAARRSLGDDVEAIGAFGRPLARVREVA